MEVGKEKFSKRLGSQGFTHKSGGLRSPKFDPNRAVHREPRRQHDLHVLDELVRGSIRNSEVPPRGSLGPWGLASVGSIYSSPLASLCSKVDIATVLEVLLKGWEGSRLAVKVAQH